MLRIEIVSIADGPAVYGPGNTSSHQLWPLTGAERNPSPPAKPMPPGRNGRYLRLLGPYYLAVTWGDPPTMPHFPSGGNRD